MEDALTNVAANGPENR